jgi:hypothetical protein
VAVSATKDTQLAQQHGHVSRRGHLFGSFSRAVAELERRKGDPLALEAAAGLKLQLEGLIGRAERACAEARKREERAVALSPSDLEEAERVGLVREVSRNGDVREYEITPEGRALAGRR